ncbi:22584_t:CDS:2 [Entrophospora sp. SA101]|nr:22584_t:CDS:2 [Entrophospora sp. SA101]
MSDNIEGSTLNQITIENGDSPTLTDIKRLGWDDKEFVKSKLSINEISDKDKSDNPKDKPKYCSIWKKEKSSSILRRLETKSKKITKEKKNSESKETPKLMMLRRSNKDEKKYKIYSMEYNSNADDHLELLDTHNIYSDETPKIYYDDNHFLAAASHSLISEWNYCYKGYNYKQNYYLKYNDYIVLNKQNKAEEALMVADYRRNSKLVVYSLERNITVSSLDFVYVDNGTFGCQVTEKDLSDLENDEHKINNISEKYWKSEYLAKLKDKKDKIKKKINNLNQKEKDYLTKLENEIKRINDILNPPTTETIKDLIANNEYKGLYANPIIEDGKDYKWTITHNKEFQRINIRVLNKDKKNSNSGSEYDSEYDLSHDETFIKCKLFHDGLILITTNYIQIFAVDDEKKLIYVRYIKSHNLSIESLKKNIKSIEKDYEGTLIER